MRSSGIPHVCCGKWLCQKFGRLLLAHFQQRRLGHPRRHPETSPPLACSWPPVPGAQGPEDGPSGPETPFDLRVPPSVWCGSQQAAAFRAWWSNTIYFRYLSFKGCNFRLKNGADKSSTRNFNPRTTRWQRPNGGTSGFQTGYQIFKFLRNFRSILATIY